LSKFVPGKSEENRAAGTAPETLAEGAALPESGRE